MSENHFPNNVLISGSFILDNNPGGFLSFPDLVVVSKNNIQVTGIILAMVTIQTARLAPTFLFLIRSIKISMTQI